MAGMIISAFCLNAIIAFALFCVIGFMADDGAKDSTIIYTVESLAFIIGFALNLFRDDLRNSFVSIAIDTTYQQASNILLYTVIFWMTIGLGGILNSLLHASKLGKHVHAKVTTGQ